MDISKSKPKDAKPSTSGPSLHSDMHSDYPTQTAFSNSSTFEKSSATKSLSDSELVVKLSGASSSNRKTCRICFLSDSESEEGICSEELQLPGCKCNGPGLYTHTVCLQKWIDIRGNNRCEICRNKFKLAVSEAALERHRAAAAVNEHSDRTVSHQPVFIQLPNNRSIRRVGGVLPPNSTQDLQFYRVEETNFFIAQRPVILTIFILLSIITFSSAAFIIFEEYETVTANDTVITDNEGDERYPDHGNVNETTVLIFVFVLTLTIMCAMFWCCVEIFLIPYLDENDAEDEFIDIEELSNIADHLSQNSSIDEVAIALPELQIIMSERNELTVSSNNTM